MNQVLLDIKNLTVRFNNNQTPVTAVAGLSLTINQGEIFGLVGESGCGKSVTALSILRLVASPPGQIVAGEIVWKERDLLKLPLSELLKIRGKEIGMIFQEPMSSFNPVKKIGVQISEAYEIHNDMNILSRNDLQAKVLEVLKQVEIQDPKRFYDSYPHELSGGMRQRAMIAMALINQPQLLIADEPTTALDVTVQAQILDLMLELQRKTEMAVLLITHNLGIVAEVADRVGVMYLGKLVELTDVYQLFNQPLHPYTQGLLKSVPSLLQTEALQAIPGQIPDPDDLPNGCYFAPRCPKAMDICKQQQPNIREFGQGHQVACWLY
ncbi:MAG TPA: ABC transporter ATP-binding protein [Bacillota bacterium]|nr:ABC transporter ATP-binding protein [Bacillota bacterium]HOL10441.1 ABC transporter ATP-binding protein [Bacillota bacterium]HPO98379.1 ABC transporter ATP-binding protein [Bacillota bacterium]